MKNLKSILIVIVILGCLVLAGSFHFRGSQAQTSTTTISAKFYKLDVLATNIELGVDSIAPGTSVNNHQALTAAWRNTAPRKLIDGTGVWLDRARD